MRRVKPKRKPRPYRGISKKKALSPNEDKYQNKGSGEWRQRAKAFLTKGGTVPVQRRRKKKNGTYHVFYEFYRPCVSCGKAGTHCDHIINASNDGVDFWDQSNWQPLCPSCHGKKSRGESNRKINANKKQNGKKKEGREIY